MTITDCTVKNNAGQWGSGIACWTETTTTIGGATVVEGNTGKGGTGVYAACYVSDRSSTMTIGGTTQINPDGLGEGSFGTPMPLGPAASEG